MNRHRLLTPADYRRMPWRNGAGRTTEIATHPADAALDAFDWRVSIADVARDGPFSRFEGIDRTIAVIAGAGMRLEGGGQVVELAELHEPYAFSGETGIECTLLGGPVRDFNLMLRRERCRGGVITVRGEGARVPPARFRLCYVASGACECLFAGHAPLTVAADECLEVEAEGAPTALSVNPLTADAVALVVHVDFVA
jgi:hypothetical protein